MLQMHILSSTGGELELDSLAKLMRMKSIALEQGLKLY